MSVIAWDGKTIAADSQATNAGMRRHAQKLHCIGGHIVGFTGSLDAGLYMVDLWRRWCSCRDMSRLDIDRAEWPSFQGTDDWCRLVVFAEGRLAIFEQRPVPMFVHEPYAAFGSGRDFALGALAMGATAQQAVEVTCKHSIECGLPVVSFEALKA